MKKLKYKILIYLFSKISKSIKNMDKSITIKSDCQTANYIHHIKKAFVILIIATLFSCSKYEDNEGLYLSSKMHRLCDKEWINKEHNELKIKFDKNNKFYCNNIYTYEWKFNNNKTKIIFNYLNWSNEIEIFKLTKSELWIGDKNETIKYENN